MLSLRVVGDTDDGVTARMEPEPGTDWTISCHLSISSLSSFGRLFPGSAGSLEQAQPSHPLPLGTSGSRYRVWPSSTRMGRQLLPASGNAGLSPCQENRQEQKV